MHTDESQLKSGAEDIQNMFRNKNVKGLRELVVTSPEEEEELPVLEMKEAEEVLNLIISEEEKENIAFLLNRWRNESLSKEERQRASNKMSDLLAILAGRNLTSELPLDRDVEQSFVFQRNLQYCQKLKRAAYNFDVRGKSEAEIDEKIEQIEEYLGLERKKASWLEQNYFPKMYGRAVRTARAEVQQFLLMQVNSDKAGLKEFFDIDSVKVELKDELNYIAEHTSRRGDSVGYYLRGKAVLSIPAFFTEEDEWKIYVRTVHELTHAVSDKSAAGKIGIEHQYQDPNFMELNEAVTEIVTHIIAYDHMSSHKTPLRSETKADMESSGYMDYIYYTKKLFDRIAPQFFIDAMLTPEGFKKLVAEFEKVFGSPQALVDFGIKLRDLYLSPQERKRKSKDTVDAGPMVVPFEGKRNDD